MGGARKAKQGIAPQNTFISIAIAIVTIGLALGRVHPNVHLNNNNTSLIFQGLQQSYNSFYRICFLQPSHSIFWSGSSYF